jgi:hypothetical protein
MIKNKKSQYYIFAVIILLSIIFLIAPKQSELGTPGKAAKNLYENYKNEIPYFANKAFLDDDELIVRNFTLFFINFASENGVNFYITYVFADSEKAVVFTTMDKIKVDAGSNYNITGNISRGIGKVSFINITIDNKRYPLQITYPSFKAILISKSENKKDVFIYE